MSLESLPQYIERGVERFAEEQHISHDEAVLRLIETGLSVVIPEQPSGNQTVNTIQIPGLSGEPMSGEDAAMMDEIVAEAMDARMRRRELYRRA